MNILLIFFLSSVFAGILPVWIGHGKDRALILDHGEEALFQWNSDSLTGVMIRNSKTKKVIQNLKVDGDWTNLGSDSDHNRESIAAKMDVNFDGNGDLLIESSSGSAGTLYRIFLYDPKSKNYLVNPENLIWNPAPDQKARILRGGPSDMKQKTYLWTGQKLTLKK